MSDLRGQIGVVHSHGFTSWLIRSLTGSYWNHTVLSLGDGIVISAETSGVKRMPVSAYPEVGWSHFDLTEQQKDIICDFSSKQVGKPYGYLHDWAIMLSIVTKRHTPAWLRRIVSDRNTWICSQLCDAAYQAAGEHLFQDLRPTGSVVPGSIGAVLYQHGWIDKP